MSKIKLIAFDLDGTLTQHKTKLSPENRAMLEKLAERYKLLMVGAGQCMRIFNQMDGFPIDVLGNYGMQYGEYDAEEKTLKILRDDHLPCDREKTEELVTRFRNANGWTEYAGNNVEFHPSGCITFPILGTAAQQEDKLAFDPDRSKRRKVYPEVCAAFPDYYVFVGGSSSYDMAPKPYNKFNALADYAKEKGFGLDEIVFVGDDYGPGGNDESVYQSEIRFVCVDDYRKVADDLAFLLED